MRKLIAVSLFSLGCSTTSEHAHHHRFEGAEEWAARFDAPDRDAWQKPDDVIRLLALSPDDVVADIGAGTGYFAVRIAPRVKKVIAADVEPDMVRYLEQRAKKERIANIAPLLVPPDSPTLGEPVDVALIVNTVHHIEKRVPYFSKLREVLKREGRVVVVDFKMGDIPHGPAESMRITPAALIEEMKAAGLLLTILDEQTLPHQYVAIFAP